MNINFNYTCMHIYITMYGIHLIRNLCALRMASLFLLPLLTRLIGRLISVGSRSISSCANSRSEVGSVNTRSNKDGMWASRIDLTYLAREIRVRMGRLSLTDVSSSITHANYIFSLYRELSRIKVT